MYEIKKGIYWPYNIIGKSGYYIVLRSYNHNATISEL